MLKASGKKFDDTNCSSPLVRRQGAEVCEHVSTCRTAEDKDRSRERAFVSWVKAERRNWRERARERNLLDCLMEARWRRPSAVVKVVDVEVPEYPRLNSDSGVDVSREREYARER